MSFDPVSFALGAASAKGGPGGASTLSGLTDVDITNPTDGQTLVYNATTDKWENGAGGGGGIYCIDTSVTPTSVTIDGVEYHQIYLSLNTSTPLEFYIIPEEVIAGATPFYRKEANGTETDVAYPDACDYVVAMPIEDSTSEDLGLTVTGPVLIGFPYPASNWACYLIPDTAEFKTVRAPIPK